MTRKCVITLLALLGVVAALAGADDSVKAASLTAWAENAEAVPGTLVLDESCRPEIARNGSGMVLTDPCGRDCYRAYKHCIRSKDRDECDDALSFCLNSCGGARVAPESLRMPPVRRSHHLSGGATAPPGRSKN